MIVPSFRLYHFAVKLIWKRMLVFTLLFWLGVAGVYYVVKRDACLAGIRLVAADDGGWHLFSLMDVKLMLMIMRHEEKKKWKR